MRTDCILDKRQVLCRHSSYSGYSRVQCRVGHLFLFQYPDGGSHIGRMLARIAYAPAVEAGEKPIRNWICAAVLAQDLSFMMERWVNPEWVTAVYDLRDVKTRAVVACFLGNDLQKSAKRDIGEVRSAVSELWSTLSAYRKYMAKREADHKDYLARKSAEVHADV